MIVLFAPFGFNLVPVPILAFTASVRVRNGLAIEPSDWDVGVGT